MSDREVRRSQFLSAPSVVSNSRLDKSELMRTQRQLGGFASGLGELPST